VDTWLVLWRDGRDQEQRREYATFLEAWTFNEESLKGRGEVILLTDRPTLTQARTYRSEAAAAKEMEGGRRFVPRKKQ